MSAHGYVAYTRGCRCETCRAAKAAYMREKRSAAKSYAGDLITDQGRYVARIPTHGTQHGYQNHKCRCPDCTAAYARAQRRQRRARVSPP